MFFHETTPFIFQLTSSCDGGKVDWGHFPWKIIPSDRSLKNGEKLMKTICSHLQKQSNWLIFSFNKMGSNIELI